MDRKLKTSSGDVIIYVKGFIAIIML